MWRCYLIGPVNKLANGLSSWIYILRATHFHLLLDAHGPAGAPSLCSRLWQACPPSLTAHWLPWCAAFRSVPWWILAALRSSLPSFHLSLSTRALLRRVTMRTCKFRHAPLAVTYPFPFLFSDEANYFAASFPKWQISPHGKWLRKPDNENHREIRRFANWSSWCFPVPWWRRKRFIFPGYRLPLVAIITEL